MRAEYVYYAAEDCAGLLRRTAAIAVDLVVLGLLLVPCAVVLEVTGAVSLLEGQIPRWFVAANLVFAYLYLTVLKRSPVRTPGYRVTGLRIVNLRGEPPSLILMTLRLLWWALGPINPLLDLFFISSNERRQTIRDKLLGTYVVRLDASPAGTGHKVMGSSSFMGLMLMFPTVVPDEARPERGPAGSSPAPPDG